MAPKFSSQVTAILALFIASVTINAGAMDIYKCPGGTYTNSPSEAKAKGCTRLAKRTDSEPTTFDAWADKTLADPQYSGYTRQELREHWDRTYGTSSTGLNPVSTSAGAADAPTPRGSTSATAKPLAQDSFEGQEMGTFSIWHWVVLVFMAVNLAMILHVAISDRTRGAVKAVWLIAALIIPVLPYLIWLVARPSEQDAVTSDRVRIAQAKALEAEAQAREVEARARIAQTEASRKT
jgi:hypothetical protein